MGQLDKSKWQAAAELLSRNLRGQPARLEVVSEEIGDQIAVDWAPLLGVTYDPKDDLFEIQLEGVDHLVSHPRTFAIRESAGMADSLEVIDDQGAEHIVQLRHPMFLPPPPV
jgi:hypothetical protein